MMPKIFRLDRKHLVLGYLVLLGLSGAIILWINTRIWGIGVGYDSYYYLSAADNFLSGNGMTRFNADGNLIPIIHYPPAYPIILAVTNFIFSGDVLMGARILAVVFWGINIIIIGWLIFAFTESVLAAVLGSVGLLLSPFSLEVHLMAMTEPMFLAIILLTLYLLSRYLQFPSTKNLVISGVFAGLSFLVRYSGAYTIVVGLVVILILRNKKMSQKLKEATYFGLTSVLVILPWLIRNWVLTGNFTNRSPVFHIPNTEKLMDGIYIASTWISPTLIPGVFATGRIALMRLMFVVVAIIVGIIVWAMRSKGTPNKLIYENREFRFVAILSISIIVYLLSLLVSLSFFDASTSMDNRILSPLYVVGITLGMIVIWQGYAVSSSRILSLAVLVVGVLFLSHNNFDRYQLELERMYNKGKGFTGREWQNSETIAEIRQLPSYLVYYSNEPTSLFFLANRLSYAIPENIDPVKVEENLLFNSQMESMRKVFEQSQGVLVLFDSFYKHDVYAPEQELTQGLYLWKDTNDGAIYFPVGVVP